ncbi:hypothetical protein [Teichococcus oryzae]|uniref:Uncharacterized protein n=1 Tax=Teichococcus oryzae TaxID=1608942 RepID=A0A5B2TJC3_9PROT|nr:hypothetical protein [Pseudoroseomonas oryzae]KAA2214075.1 hypothetical protein F0Q34_08555 [Pseudoroseomonas oryzae]
MSERTPQSGQPPLPPGAHGPTPRSGQPTEPASSEAEADAAMAEEQARKERAEQAGARLR